MPIHLLGFVDGELHAIPLEEAVGIAPAGIAACEVPAFVARIEATAAIEAARAEGREGKPADGDPAPPEQRSPR